MIVRSVLSAVAIYLIAITVFALFHGGLRLDYVRFLARENLTLGLVILALLLVRNLWFRRR
jgi:hypothetical protein